MTVMTNPSAVLSDRDFDRIRVLMRDQAAIDLLPTRKILVTSRLLQRLRELGMQGFDEYIDYIDSGFNPAELQQAVDLLTTHETYFFREPEHFEHLGRTIVPTLAGTPLRFWSAAASTGEEAYSIAMQLMTTVGFNQRWEVVGTDVSRDAVARATRGVYRTDRMELMPPALRNRFCRAEGDMISISPQIRERVSFRMLNLACPLATLGMFDVVFLRNVLIYFDKDARRQILRGICQQIKPGGWLVLGHAEIMCVRPEGFVPHTTTIYRKPAAPPTKRASLFDGAAQVANAQDRTPSFAT